MTSSTVENYLKQLYLESQAPGAELPLATGRIAAAMGVTPGTATAMIKTLAQAGLVEHATRRGVLLTDRGERVALHVLRRHRLLEQFLVEVLGMNWSVVHEEADRLEHAVSDRVLDRIDALLGHPKVDPHGDPIPAGEGHVEAHPGSSLADCPLDADHRVSRIVDQDPAFLQFAERNGLVPGASIRVVARDPAAGALTVTVGATGPAGGSRQGEVSLGFPAASHILLAADLR